MRVRGLDDREYSWSLSSRPRANASKHHVRARNLLKKMYPCDSISEELALPGSRTKQNGTLFADFYLSSRKIMIEVQGEQHESFSMHLHKGDKRNFFKGKARDNTKRNWCLLNGITLIQLPYNESDDEWEARILNLGEE